VTKSFNSKRNKYDKIDNHLKIDIHEINKGTRNDYIWTSIRYTKYIIGNSVYFRDYGSYDPKHDLCLEYIPNMEEVFKLSYRQIKGHGSLYRKSYCVLYKSELSEMFERGVHQSSFKIIHEITREQICDMYPRIFHILDETEIKSFISVHL